MHQPPEQPPNYPPYTQQQPTMPSHYYPPVAPTIPAQAYYLPPTQPTPPMYTPPPQYPPYMQQQTLYQPQQQRAVRPYSNATLAVLALQYIAVWVCEIAGGNGNGPHTFLQNLGICLLIGGGITSIILDLHGVFTLQGLLKWSTVGAGGKFGSVILAGIMVAFAPLWPLVYLIRTFLMYQKPLYKELPPKQKAFSAFLVGYIVAAAFLLIVSLAPIAGK